MAGKLSTLNPIPTINEPNHFKGDPVEINASDWTLVHRVVINAADELRVIGAVGEDGDLSGLKATIRAIENVGVEIDYLEDEDFDVVSDEGVLWTTKTTSGPNVYQTPAGGTFGFKVKAKAIREITFYAKGDATTLALELVGQ